MKVLIALLTSALFLEIPTAFASDNMGWKQECHFIDGHQECAGHLEGCVRECNGPVIE